MLGALAEALPDEGRNVITRVEFADGWGDMFHIRLHTVVPRLGEAGERLVDEVRTRIAEAVGARRHYVEIVWSSSS